MYSESLKFISIPASEGSLVLPHPLVVDDEKVSIDLPGRKLDFLVDAKELDTRKKAWKKPVWKFTRGWLSRYERLVTSASTGAVLKPPKD